MSTPQIVHGDCLEIMKMLPDNSVDSIVTDPPYGLGFMGKAWDALPPGREWAEECLRVLKPGGHLLAFGGTRTWHRLAVAVEDAGFEIRDSIAWMYGSGFPKSLDVAKAIDKRRDDSMAVEGVRAFLEVGRQDAGITRREIAESFDVDSRMVQKWMGAKPDKQRHCPTWEQWLRLKDLLKLTNDMDAEVARLNGRKGENGEAWADRQIIGHVSDRRGDGTVIGLGHSGELNRATSATAQPWQGWGTALKPAFEPVVVARKKLKGTVASNVLDFGTGAINIDASRNGQRWPANVILDESQESALEESKYFYVAKPSKAERPVAGSVAHQTVKPLALMRWLVRLVTPPGGTVLEPFAGSGTTVEACILEGFNCIAIEREAEYLPLIQARIDRQEVA